MRHNLHLDPYKYYYLWVFSEDVYLKAKGLNHADIVRACEDSVKFSILEEKKYKRYSISLPPR